MPGPRTGYGAACGAIVAAPGIPGEDVQPADITVYAV
jgi:hypothetical protein